MGVVYVNTADDEVRHPWARAVQNAGKPSMRLRGADGRGIDTWPQLQASAVVSAAAADALFAGGDRSAAELFDAAPGPGDAGDRDDGGRDDGEALQ